MGKASAKFEVIHEIMIQEGNLQNVQELCRIATMVIPPKTGEMTVLCSGSHLSYNGREPD